MGMIPSSIIGSQHDLSRRVIARDALDAVKAIVHLETDSPYEKVK
jgi:hypothetical protein